VCAASARTPRSIIDNDGLWGESIAPTKRRTGANKMLRIEYRKLDSLIPYAGNARLHPKKQVEQLKSSILVNGFTNPILVDNAGVVIAGHGRLIAARE
jgi:hypothetical protein